MGENKNEVTIGQIHEPVGHLKCEWGIPQFSCLSKDPDQYYRSPDFHCAGATWYLKVYPNGDSRHSSTDHIGLFVMRGDSGEPLSMTYTLGLETIFGQEEQLLHEENVFGKKDEGWGGSRLVSKSDLEKRNSEFILDDVLTVFCMLSHSDPCTVIRTDKLCGDLKRLMLNEVNSDVTVTVQGNEFRLHRNILACRSPVFSAMFKNDMVEAETVTLDDCDPGIFRMLCDYLYTGRVDNLLPQNAYALHELAEKYVLNELKEDCFLYVKNEPLPLDNIFQAIRMAHMHGDNKLMKRATDFFREEMEDVMETPEWINFMKENPQEANKLLKEALSKKRAKKE